MYAWMTLLLSVSAGLASPSMSGREPLERLRQDAMERYAREDYPGFVARMEQLALSSREERDLYNLACGYALSGQREEALALLQRLVERGLSLDFEGDSDFDSLRSHPAFAEIVAARTYRSALDERLEPLRQRAMGHYHQGRYDLFVSVLEPLVEHDVNDIDLYNLACGYALTGRREESLVLLQRLAERGSDYGAAHDGDFDSLRADPRFVAILARLSAL